MATIQQNLNKIATAVYGEEVRTAIKDAIEQCYSDTSKGKTTADAAAATATSAASSANTAASSANTAATNANNSVSSINTALAQSPALGTTNTTVLSNGTDYNTLTTPGTFTANTDSNAASMINCPTTIGHKLIVVQINNATPHLMQIVIDRDGTKLVNNIYRRMYNASTKVWGDWVSDNQRIDEIRRQVTALRSSNTKIYGVRWDGTNAKCTRLYDAADITADTADFCYLGSVKTINNPFDNIYPWNQMAMCNVDLDAYRALKPGDDVRDAVVAWKGDSGFSFDGSKGFVGAYRPQYWYNAWADGDGIIFAISTGKIDGWAESKPYIRGMGFATKGATDTTISCSNGQPRTNAGMNTLHTYAKNTGIAIEDIYTYSAELTAFVVEYATLNTQAALGSGVSDLYRSAADEHPLSGGTNISSILLPSAMSSFMEVGATLDFATAENGVDLTKRTAVTGYATEGSNIRVSVSPAITIDDPSAVFVSVHGRSNYISGQMASKAPSGYLGTNGKTNAFYRGSVLHGNRFRYVLGVYRQTGTSEAWICEDPDACNNYDALNTTVHKSTGLVLPTGVDGAAVSAYINSIGLVKGLGAVPIGLSTGGNSSNPVGDYIWVPALTAGNTVLIVGGNAGIGATGGGFYGVWTSPASYSYWADAVFPLLKSP